MPVAEILAGIALVSKSAEIISKGISACKDIGGVASEIDNLFLGQKQLAQQAKQVKATGGSATQIIIDQRLAAEAIADCKALIIGRFGWDCWQDIIKLQREMDLADKHKAAAAVRAKAETVETMQDVAVVGGSVFIGILILAVVGAVLLAMG